jgi:tetratricopeptide (TPR) repeat protein
MFAVIMLGATLFFAYQIYRHVQTLEDPKEENNEVAVTAAEAIIMNPTAALMDEADEAYGEGDLERALDKLKRVSLLSADNPEILNKLGFVNGKMGNMDEAIALYTRSLELDESDDLTHNALASMYKVDGNFELAQEHYEKALAIDSNYAITYYNYGNLLNDQGQFDKAEAMYSRALALQEEFPEAREALEELKAMK